MLTAIHWFRRDLRITDNTALAAAHAAAGQVIPVYVQSTWRMNHRWTGPNRQGFLCGCLRALDGNLRAIGSRLIVRRGNPVDELAALAREADAQAIFYNRDPDPHGRALEAKLAAAARSGGFEVFGFKDHCLHERDEILTSDGKPFRVFTPYSKAWMRLSKPAPAGRLRSLRTPTAITSQPLPKLDDWGLTIEADIPEPGEKAARGRLTRWLASGIETYGRDRNIPAGQTTSRLSQDLRHGLLSIREIFARCIERSESLPAAGRASVTNYVNELVWREFYAQILWHFPQVLDVEFNPTFRGIKWRGELSHFDRWCCGETGFPVVDAAMRQLNATGFMHNRTRMIAAMFLTKDLQIDWRLGERYFMQKLTDGEIASNNGGWQWSAGTGADAAPYFRIQNPWTQTSRYDPEGEYIKRWVPELRNVPSSKFLKPPEPGRRLASDYPPPVVDHAQAREKALEMFSSHRDQSSQS